MAWGVHDYPGPPPETPLPICPVCGEEIDVMNGWVVKDNNTHEVIGCNNCLHLVYADSYAEEFMD